MFEDSEFEGQPPQEATEEETLFSLESFTPQPSPYTDSKVRQEDDFNE